MTKRLFLVLFGAWCGAAFAALPSEITVTLKPAHDVYALYGPCVFFVVGE